MSKKNKFLLSALLVLIVAVVSITFFRFYVARDYLVISEIECDPEINNCFVWVNDDGEEEYYAYLEKMAYNIPLCNPHREECEELSCGENEEECETFFCDPSEVGEGEYCSGL